jgi:uncharacterized protein (DUF488 family)
MLYTGTFRDIDYNKYDEIWLIVRSLKAMPKNPKQNIHHVPVLSPSLNLFFKFQNWKKLGQWNQQTFDTLYTPTFLQEMLQPKQKMILNELAEKSKTQDILIACYCTDEHICHRTLIKKIIDTINS